MCWLYHLSIFCWLLDARRRNLGFQGHDLMQNVRKLWEATGTSFPFDGTQITGIRGKSTELHHNRWKTGLILSISYDSRGFLHMGLSENGVPREIHWLINRQFLCQPSAVKHDLVVSCYFYNPVCFYNPPIRSKKKT